MRYVRSNFIYGRDFLGEADLDAQRLWWLEHVANARQHRTIDAVPRVRFEAEERAVLQPLAPRAYRPLVLPPERLTRRTLVRPLAPPIIVERRGLATYQALVPQTEEVAR